MAASTHESKFHQFRGRPTTRLLSPQANRSDTDNDGVFNDDEINVYGTNSNKADAEATAVTTGRRSSTRPPPMTDRQR
jgi:hypothetical protein